MAKETKAKTDTPLASPTEEKPAAKPAAPSRKYKYVGPFAIHIVFFNPSERIMPAGMSDDDIEKFIQRRPEAAKYWTKTT